MNKKGLSIILEACLFKNFFIVWEECILASKTKLLN